MARLAISLAHAPLRERPALAHRADEAGFETIWVEDGDAFVALAYMAPQVKRASLATGIARAFARSAMVTATASANLQDITGGRFILGLGTGTKRQNLFQLGQEYDHPASRVAELRELLRQIWSHDTETPMEFKGKFYDLRFDGPTLERAHSNTPIPVYLAAVNDYMLYTAGRHFDGLAGHPCFSAAYLEQVVVPQVEKGLAAAGRPRQDFTMSSWIITSIDDDRGMARKRAAYQLGYYLSTKSYGKLLDWHGWHEEKEKIRKAYFEKRDWDAIAAAVSDDMIDTMAVAGTPSDCVDQLERYMKVLDVPVLYSHAAGPARADAAANLDRILRTFG